jgi:hypothetical protein
VEELRLALEVAHSLGHYADVPFRNVDVVHGNVGNLGVGGSNHGGDTVGARYTPSNIYNYSSVSFIPIGEVNYSSKVVVETKVSMLPGSTVPAMSRVVEDTLAFLKSHPESTFPALEEMPIIAVPAANVEMLEVADSMKMLSATSVTGGALNFANDTSKKSAIHQRNLQRGSLGQGKVVKNKVAK